MNLETIDLDDVTTLRINKALQQSVSELQQLLLALIKENAALEEEIKRLKSN